MTRETETQISMLQPSYGDPPDGQSTPESLRQTDEGFRRRRLIPTLTWGLNARLAKRMAQRPNHFRSH